METFHSIQGEGLHGGRSAWFIRLGGCNVGCSWCDTKHSWPTDQHPKRALAELADEAHAAAIAGAAFAVITGGEPLHHDLGPLCDALRQSTAASALALHLETSGVDPLSGHFDWITLSPKPHRPPTQELLAACHELKVVVSDAGDLAFAEAMAEAAAAAAAAAQTPGPALLLQPVWGSDSAQQLVLEHVSRQPHWRLSLQTHKWLAIR